MGLFVFRGCVVIVCVVIVCVVIVCVVIVCVVIVCVVIVCLRRAMVEYLEFVDCWRAQGLYH